VFLFPSWQPGGALFLGSAYRLGRFEPWGQLRPAFGNSRRRGL
jgi:hypothetical protein